MAILGSIPVLNCHSLKQTLIFYQQLLQFVVVNKRELDDDLQWVHLMHGETSLMLQVADQDHSETEMVHESSINLYFFVNDISELHHYIKAKNNEVSGLKDTEYHMQEFSLIDPEGNRVTIGQKIKSS